MCLTVQFLAYYTNNELFSPYVKSSLATLMSQVSAYEKLKEKMIVPGAVLGYCLGSIILLSLMYGSDD